MGLHAILSPIDGSSDTPAILLMHGRLQQWQSIYELLGDLEQDYRLIWRGEKGPYARKPDNILKQYIPGCEEIVFKGLGRSQMFYFHGDKGP